MRNSELTQARGYGYVQFSPHTDFGEPGCVSSRENTDFRRLVIRLLSVFSFLIKVFWKGEFEGKNLFFKKGFPLILFTLEKTSIIGSQLAGDRKFFQATKRKIFQYMKINGFAPIDFYN